MMEFLNIDLIPVLVNFVYFVATIIENYLFLIMLLLIFDVSATFKQKIIYLLLILTISNITTLLIPSPFNVIINYACIAFLLKVIFKLSIIKSLTSLIITFFVFGLLNILIQNPYFSILNISFETFENTPKYRIPYLILLYSTMACIIIFLSKFRKMKLNLDLLDSLDKKTKIILYLNLITGFMSLCIQLLITVFYLDIVPIFITISNFVVLVAFLIISIYSFTRIIKLAVTKKNLEYAEDYNKSLEILYDEVKGFKHSFNSMISYIDGYIEDNDMNGLKKYFNQFQKEYNLTHDLSIINPHIINNPGIYSLLNNKYFKAINSGITFDIEFFLKSDELKINMYIFSRILGILIDNAIEEAEKCTEKLVKISFIRESKNSRAVITIENTCSNININLDEIFKKGISGKENHSGIGLWEVKKYIKKSKNLDLKTSITEKYFKQELFIYDL